MTMGKKLRAIPAGEFKAKVLAILDEVAATGETVVVTKRGKPVAKVGPATTDEAGGLKGSIVWEGDIVSPVLEPFDL